MAVYAIDHDGISVAQIAALIGFASFLIVYAFRLVWLPIVLAVCRKDRDTIITRRALEKLARETSWPIIIGLWHPKRLVTRVSVGDKRLFSMRVLDVIAWLSAALASFLVAWPLRETPVLGDNLRNLAFIYSRDTSFFGISTQELGSSVLTRSCGLQTTIPCPNAGPETLDYGIPQSIREIFGQHWSESTYATPFDVRYRRQKVQQVTKSNTKMAEGEAAVGDFQPLVSHALDDSYSLVEGLILDTKMGGIGLRNHTIPWHPGVGAQWHEDIMWITPVSACTDTNLTFHYSQGDGTAVLNGYMEDSGGFSQLAPSIPEPRWDLGYSSESAPVPDLQYRSYNLAWWNNNLTATYLNLSHSPEELGQQYSDQLQNYFQNLFFPSEIAIFPVDGSYLGNASSKPDPLMLGKFVYYGDACSGFNEISETAVGLEPYIRCGYFFGIPTPEEGQSFENNYGSKWVQKLYTCASSVKASYKKVTFQIGNTPDLFGVTVLSVQEKNYSTNSDPLWGIERAPGYVIQDINRVWGEIREDLYDSPLLDTIRAPELYLPAVAVGSNEPYSLNDPYNRYLSDSRDTFAAGYAFTAAWNDVYNRVAALGDVGIGGSPVYNGRTNYAQTLKWRALGSNVSGAAQILNLIWTDLASFSVVATRTGFEETQSHSANSLGERQVQPLTHLVIYGNSAYMVPGLIVLGLVFVFACLSLALFFMPCGKYILTFKEFKEIVESSHSAAKGGAAAANPTTNDTTSVTSSATTNTIPHPSTDPLLNDSAQSSQQSMTQTTEPPPGPQQASITTWG